MAGVGTTHHVQVGSDLLVLRQGTYRKKGAPLFGARFTTGDPDYNNLSFWQHWVQTCWIGGMGAEAWSDDSMFYQGRGIDIGTHEVAALSRDLSAPAGKGYGLTGTAVEREFVVFDGNLYCLEITAAGSCKLYRYYAATDTWTLKKTFTEAVRGVCAFSGKLWFGDGGGSLTYMTDAGAFGTKIKPSGRVEIPYVMKVFKGLMYVGFGRYLWRMKGSEDWDGSTVFFDMAGVNYLQSMELHQGFLYMGSQNGHILRTDGNVTQDMWSWDGGVVVESMRSYDGKLFVGTKEERLDTTATEGALYQFTGTAVTELKRWGKSGFHTPIRKMRVARRHLFYGAASLLGMGDGFGVAAYNAVEDSHCVFAENTDGITYPAGTNGVNHIVDDVIAFGGWLFAAVRGFGVFKTKAEIRDADQALATYDTTGAGDAPASQNGGWLTSSDFDAGTPGLNKLWRRMVVHIDLPSSATSFTAEVSLDGGRTWIAHSPVVGDGINVRRAWTWYMGESSTRLRWRITLRTTDTTKSPALRGVVVSYLPIGDPNWQWEFMAVLAQEVELLDGTTATQDVAGIAGRLEAAYRAQTPIYFKDVDGSEWIANGVGVLITDFQKDLRFIGPASDGPLEGDIRMTLVEAIEQDA